MTDYLPWLLLGASGIGLAWACRALAADARAGVYVTMGGQMLYSHTWVVSALAGAAGLATLPGVRWWWGLVLLASLLALMWPVSRVIVMLFLARDEPPRRPGGFADFDRKARGSDHNAES